MYRGPFYHRRKLLQSEKTLATVLFMQRESYSKNMGSNEQ